MRNKELITNEKRIELMSIYRDNPAAASRDLLGIDLAPHQRVILRSMWDCNNVIIILNRGAGKCERYKNLVQTREGFKKIGDICTENGKKFGFSYYNKEVRGENGFKNAIYTYINDKKPIYNIVTSFGYEKGAVGKHRIRVFDNGLIKWKRLDDIKIGDYVVIDRDDYYFHCVDKDLDKSYEIGRIIGAYNILNNENIVKDFKPICCNEFLYDNDVKNTPSHLKEIPPSILQSNKNALSSFLSGLFDASACIIKNGIEISSMSESLIEQVQVVLLSYGIVSKRRNSVIKNEKSDEIKLWTLTIENDNIDLFNKKIGFRCKLIKNSLINISDKIMDKSEDFVPGIYNFILDLRERFLYNKSLDMLDKNIRNILCIDNINKRCVSYKWLGYFLDLTKDIKCESYDILKEIYDKHYFFDKVESIEILPDEVTYDFSIPDGNNFISNGFISHNTFIDAVFAVLRAMLYPGEKVGIFSSSYRQAKFVFSEIEKIYDISPILRDSCEKKPTKMVDMCYLQFKSTGNKPGSVIHALPLGDGCQVADTYILTENGFIKIGDLFTDKYEDKTWHDSSGKIWSNGLFRNIDAKFYNGKSKTKKISTKKGFTFESTLTHKYKIFDGSNIKWKKVDELSIGDKILIDKSVRWHCSDTSLTSDECYAFGAIIGDGNLTRQSGIVFASSEEDNDILEFIKLGTPFVWNKCSDGVHWCGSGGDKMKNDYLSKFGYSEENYVTINKVIPKIIMNSSKEKMSAFISGLFDTDGGVYVVDKNVSTSISVCFYNTSETLIKQLQYILLHYGITANVSKRNRGHDNMFGDVNWNDSYELHITGKDVLIFANEIGFRLPRKKKILEEEVKRKKIWFSIKDDEVPINKDELIHFRKNHKPDVGYVNNRSYIIADNIKNKKYITKDFIRKLLSMYSDTKHQYLDKLNEFCREDVYYDTIDTIIDSEAETMDIQIPDGNEYCANGFFSHNSTIRGARYFTIIGDEAAQIPREVLDVVVRGMMATSKNPMEQVKAMSEQKKLLEQGKIKSIKRLHNNKIVLSSTAYYQYNHLWNRVKGYIDIIMEKAEKSSKMKKLGMEISDELKVELRGHDLNNQIPFNVMKDENRALIAFNCDDMPDGFMNTESIEEARREMPRYQFLMEYYGYFPPDSEGFFPMSLLDKSRKHGDFTCEFSFDPQKEKDYITIMGCDPARSGDNFAISIFKVNIKTEKVRLIRVLTYNKMTFPFMHLEIRRLRKLYNVSEIAMDSGGGGQTIRDLLSDSRACPAGDDIILQRDFDEHRFKHGKRILRLVEFSKYEWLSDANNNLLLGLQNGTLQIAGEKGSLKNASDFNETPEEEAARKEIDKTIEEMQNIVVTRTQTGRMHWDTPQRRQRKDRYSAVLIGYDQAYSYLDNINKPQTLVSGFWS